MKLIGLTGGIASGKSTIARRLESLGAVRIDADQLAREAVLPGTPALAQIQDRFGSDLLTASGELDRPELGRRVFGDPVALDALNRIVHPAVRALATERIAEAERRDPNAVVVYEIPLLVETATTGVGERGWDLVVVADAPAPRRIERLVTLRGLSETEATRRVESQATDADRRSAADVLIDTSGTEAQTLQQVDDLWERITLARTRPTS